MTRLRTLLIIVLLVLFISVSSQIGWSQKSGADSSQPSIPHVTLTFTTIDCGSGAAYTTATGINNSGVVVGGCGRANGSLDNGYERFSGMIRRIDVPGTAATNATDINSSGEIAGIADLTTSSGAQGFLLKDGAYTTIDDTAGIQTVVTGINTAGATVGYWNDNHSNTHGFVYENGTFIPVSVPGCTILIPKGLNSSTIVGQCITSSERYAFLKQGRSFTNLKFPGALSTNAHSIDASGEVIGLYEDSSFVYHGFLWWHGAFVETFDLQGATLSDDAFTRLSLNDMGQIVGTYEDTRFVQHGFVANLPRLN